MKLHRLNDGNYSVKIKGLDGEFITSSWSTAMEIAIQENSQYGLVVSSRVIAKELEKRHDAVLRDLENILKNSIHHRFMDYS